MKTAVVITLIVAIFGLCVMLFALLKVAHDADERAGYMEEYGSDFDEEE